MAKKKGILSYIFTSFLDLLIIFAIVSLIDAIIFNGSFFDYLVQNICQFVLVGVITGVILWYLADKDVVKQFWGEA